MIDLLVNFGGGILGAIIGGLYIRHSRKTHSRRFVEVMEALSEVADNDGEEPGAVPIKHNLR